MSVSSPVRPHSGVPPGTFKSPVDPVEESRNKFDLRPTVQFVADHLNRYQSAYFQFLSQEPKVLVNTQKVLFTNKTFLDQAKPQILPEQIPDIICRLPHPIIQLSLLKEVDYDYAAKVPIPRFDSEGNWTKEVDFVALHRFPRPKDHPGRILIGYSTGDKIFPSPLPISVYGESHARWFYQLHVFLHEYFHTIEYLRRDPEIRQTIVFIRGSSHFTFEDWWVRWENYFLRNSRPQFASRYAANYKRFLTEETKVHNNAAFTEAIAEQICESFVGYILGIIPNDENNPDFKAHSEEAWRLMDKLGTATLISK